MLWVHIIFGGLGKTKLLLLGMALKTSHACIAESGMHFTLEHVYLIEGWRIAPPNKAQTFASFHTLNNKRVVLIPSQRAKKKL